MRKLIFVLIVVLLFPAVALADGFYEPYQPPADPKPEAKEEISAEEQPASGWESATQDSTSQDMAQLRAEISDLKDMVKSLISDYSVKTEIAVLPIENANRIPQVGDGLRDMIVSSFVEHGLPVVESLDDETLKWVRRQNDLVREGLVDPYSVPRPGELQAPSHFLLASVTKYEERDDEFVKAGIVTIFGNETRTRIGSLVIDFKVVDARTGEVVLAFCAESCLKFKEIAGVVVGKKSTHMPMPEAAARDCSCQAACRLAEVFSVKK